MAPSLAEKAHRLRVHNHESKNMPCRSTLSSVHGRVCQWRAEPHLDKSHTRLAPLVIVLLGGRLMDVRFTLLYTKFVRSARFHLQRSFYSQRSPQFQSCQGVKNYARFQLCHKDGSRFQCCQELSKIAEKVVPERQYTLSSRKRHDRK